jgi:hypothetical protein
MELADRYRARATTVRKITDGILDEAVRAQLLIIADQYENLALTRGGTFSSKCSALTSPQECHLRY